MGANLQLWRCAGEDSQWRDKQRFVVPPDGSPGPIKWAKHPNLCLDSPGGSNLQFWACGEAPGKNTLFTVSPDGKGNIHWFAFPHLCVDVPKTKVANGRKLLMLNCSNTSSSSGNEAKFILHSVDCQLSKWTDWSHCSQTCGGGYHTRLRNAIRPALNDGKPCAGKLDQNYTCGMDNCTNDKSMGTRSTRIWSLTFAVCLLGVL